MILITGVAGFIGSNLCEGLLKRGFQVIGFDNFSTGKKKNIEGLNIDFHEVDINKESSKAFETVKNLPISHIFHYAACVGVKRTLANPLLVLEDIEGFKNILFLAKEKKAKLLFSSSSEVYGEPVEMPLKESSALNAKLPYAVVKNVGEQFIKAYSKEFDIEYTIFRFFNVFGPKQSEDFVVPKFIRQALDNQDIPVYGDGLQTRTFIYVDDNVNATINSMSGPKSGDIKNLTVNIGSEVQTTIKDLAETIIRVTNSKSKVVHLPKLEEGDMSRRQPDNSLMRKLLLDDLTPIENGLRKTVDWYVSQK